MDIVKNKMKTLMAMAISAFIVQTMAACTNTRISEPLLTGGELFYKLNLRSIGSSIGPGLKVGCGNTFFDIMQWDDLENSIVDIHEHGLDIETEIGYYTLRIEPDGIWFIDDFKVGTYYTSEVFPVSFDPKTGYWVGPYKDDLIRTDCVENK
ncbi:MAG: hypothetical protein COB59_05865 [Rhodospirillaceae bacterium]|nr:MAG: hypothetical protein COB59_05865 [Rhodospirillaceae bacterium]